MNADGTGLRRLTAAPEPDSYPDVSPDGWKVAFLRRFAASRDLVVANADGSGPRRLTTGRSFVTVSWSPDGTRLGATEDDGTAVVLRPDGAEVARFVPPDFDGNDYHWEPLACTVRGTAGNDVLTGTPGDDVLCGFGGDDVVRRLGGNDTLLGYSGADRLDGGEGDDAVVGFEGADALAGGPGADRCDAGVGRDAAAVGCEETYDVP